MHFSGVWCVKFFSILRLYQLVVSSITQRIIHDLYKKLQITEKHSLFEDVVGLFSRLFFLCKKIKNTEVCAVQSPTLQCTTHLVSWNRVMSPSSRQRVNALDLITSHIALNFTETRGIPQPEFEWSSSTWFSRTEYRPRCRCNHMSFSPCCTQGPWDMSTPWRRSARNTKTWNRKMDVGITRPTQGTGGLVLLKEKQHFQSNEKKTY